MAQLLQPGMEGGNDEKKTSEYGVYQCVFRETSDSLYLMVKDRKSKRSFSNTFSKSTLIDMDLKQSIDKIINLLESAKSGEKSELKFNVRFGDAENIKKVSINQLSKSYNKGCALYIIISVDQSWFSAEYSFKLLEQKRNETDILRDIITDMQQEIDELKNKNPAVGVAMWQISREKAAANGDLVLDTESIAPTLKGMAKLSGDKKSVAIGISGLYRITATLNWSGGGCNGDDIQIKINGNQFARKYTGCPYGPGTIDRIFNLKKHDKVTFYAGCIQSHTTGLVWNSFTFRKL